MRSIVGGLVVLASDFKKSVSERELPSHIRIVDFDRKNYLVHNKLTGKVKLLSKKIPGSVKKALGAATALGSVGGAGVAIWKHPEYTVPAAAAGLTGFKTGYDLYQSGDEDARKWKKDVSGMTWKDSEEDHDG